MNPKQVKVATATTGEIPCKPDSGGSVGSDIAGLRLIEKAMSVDKKQGNQVGKRSVTVLGIIKLPILVMV